MAGRKIVIEFLGKDVSADKTARAVEQRFGKLGARMDRVGQIAGKVLAGGLVVGAVAAVKAGQAAAEDEAAQVKLAQTMRNAAGASKAQVAATEDWIAAQGRALGIADDDLRPGAGKLVAATGDVEKAQRLASLAMDVSAGTGKDLGAVSQALARAQTGNTAGLSRLGIATKDASGKALTLDQIQKNLAATYRGQAAKAAETAAGKQRTLTVQMGELQEQIGAKLLPVMVRLSELGLRMVGWASQNTTTLGVLAAVFGTVTAALWATSVAMRAAATASALWSAVTKAAAAVQWVLNAAMAANPIGLVVLAIAGLIAVLVLAWNHSSTFRAIVTGAFTAVKNAAAAAFGWVRSNWPLLLAILTGPIGLAVLAIVKHWDRIKEGAAIVKNFVVDKFGDMRDRLIAIKNRMTFDGMFDGIKSAFRAAVNFIIGKWNSLSFTIGGGSIGGKKIPSITLGTPDIPYLATGGTVTRSGSALVGEAGPELLDLPRGARVTPLSGSSAGSEIQPRPLVVQLIVEGRQLGQALIDWQAATGETLRVRTT